MNLKRWHLSACLAILAGCSSTAKVALLSNGDLAGKQLRGARSGPVLEGRDCGASQYLSEALRDALKDSTYDTLTDVDVTTKTGVFVWSNCVSVRGLGLASRDLPTAGGDR